MSFLFFCVARVVTTDLNYNVVTLLCLQLVVIWNTSEVLRKREVSVLAKAHTDVDISRMIIASFDDKR